MCIRLLITSIYPVRFTSDLIGRGVKAFLLAYFKGISIIILIHLEYIFNSFYILIQFTNGAGYRTSLTVAPIRSGLTATAMCYILTATHSRSALTVTPYRKAKIYFHNGLNVTPTPQKNLDFQIARANAKPHSTQTLLISDMAKHSTFLISKKVLSL